MLIDDVLNDLFVTLEIVCLVGISLHSNLCLIILILQRRDAVGTALLLNISGDNRQNLGIFFFSSHRALLLMEHMKETILLLAWPFID